MRAQQGADNFIEWWQKADRGELDPFVLVVEGSIPNEAIKSEGYWCGFGNNPATGQPMTTNEWLDRLAPKATEEGDGQRLPPIDPCAVALAAGCTFVARSFSGDGRQLVPLIKAAISHRGTAVIDIVSPCVTFNDHDGSTKSYSWVKEHDEQIQDVTFIPYFEEIQVDYEPGTAAQVELFDGSHLVLRKLGPEHDPSDRIGAMRLVEESRQQSHLVTGLLYLDEHDRDFATRERLTERPLRDLGEDELRMSKDKFAELMKQLA